MIPMELTMIAPIMRKTRYVGFITNFIVFLTKFLSNRTDGMYYENFGYTANTACCFCGGGKCIDEWLLNNFLMFLVLIVFTMNQIQLNAWSAIQIYLEF